MLGVIPRSKTRPRTGHVHRSVTGVEDGSSRVCDGGRIGGQLAGSRAVQMRGQFRSDHVSADPVQRGCDRTEDFSPAERRKTP
jgi:hypothetical protein